MSRVAKAPVIVPKNVEIIIGDNEVSVKGPKGTLTQKINRLVSIKKGSTDSEYVFAPSSSDPNGWAQAGTARALLNNMVKGVTEGFTVSLELVGVGYRAQAKEKSITLSLGFSHPIEYLLPKGIKAETPTNTSVILSGVDKQILGQAASEIRAFRQPEPYKGKGVRYVGETIVRKEAKKK